MYLFMDTKMESKIEAGKRVLRRREGGLGNGVKNPDGERGRFRIVSHTIFPIRNGREPLKLNES